MQHKLMILGLILFAWMNSAFAQSGCYECHGEADFSRTTASGEEESLFVADSVFAASVHADFECIDCHVDAVGDPHPDSLAAVNCGLCHEDEHDQYALSVHGRRFMAGDSSAPSCSSCHGKHDIKSSSDASSRTFSVNLPNTCGECHRKGGSLGTHKVDIASPVENFEKGVHGQALLAGNDEAASCNDCHGSHLLLARSNPLSKIYQQNISKTCSTCHEDIVQEYDNSSHGKALARGEFDAPTCITCHGEHNIMSPENAGAPTNPVNIANQTCQPCHGSLKLNEKYGLLPNPTQSYESSYHGLASARGSKVAANCTSCHGVHNILGSDDPESTINPANLKQTCGACHPNASEEFTKSYVHAKPDSLTDKIAHIISKIYIWLIVIVIGGMVLHNFIIWLSYVRKKYRAMQQQSVIIRFDRHWVVQHVATFISFTLLVITGFALKFPNAGWEQFLTHLGLTEHIRGIVHRISAVVLIAAAVYQWIFLLLVRKWKGELQSLLPSFIDVREFIQHMLYHLGLRKERPDFARYSYIEKAEFWALVWGNMIMLLTGLVLWFPTFATRLFPSWGWLVKASETVHYYEAWLAALAILLYHMFFAIFHPEDYPINLTGLTGKITEEEAKERFPRWYRKLMQQERGKN